MPEPSHLAPQRCQELRSDWEAELSARPDGCKMVESANACTLQQSSANAAYERAGSGMDRTQSNAKAQEGRNFRDIASAQPERLRPGLLYRSSAFHTQDLRAEADVQAVLDLRRTGKPCHKPTRLAQARFGCLLGCTRMIHTVKAAWTTRVQELGMCAASLPFQACFGADGLPLMQEFVKPSWIVSRIRDHFKDTPAPRCPNCEEHLRTESDRDSKGPVKVRPLPSWLLRAAVRCAAMVVHTKAIATVATKCTYAA